MSHSKRGQGSGKKRGQPAATGRAKRGPDIDADESTQLLEETSAYLPVEHDGDFGGRPAGFQLRRLLLRGANIPNAELRFTAGLNVISGPSNTGKSFALYCIDFMLGAKRLAKMVPEAQAYDEAVLEIESNVGAVFTLRRPLSGGRFRWYDVPFDAIDQKTTFASLAARHSGQQPNSASAQFLALSGLANRSLLKSRANRSTQPLSFRNVTKLTVIEEQEIISPNSPVTGANPIEHTAESSLLGLLLTGQDASDVVELANPADSRRRLQAQADVLDELLDESRPPDGHDVPDGKVLERQRGALDRRADELNALVQASSGSIDEALTEGGSEQAAVLEAKSRLLTVDELLTRFALLRQSYDADLARLTLIDRGSDLLSQLPVLTCPVCGRVLGDEHTDHGEGSTDVLLGADVRAACATEVIKIRSHLADLDLAVQDLLNERAVLRERVRTGTTRLRELDRRLRDELQPRMAATTGELAEVARARQEILRLESIQQHRATLLERRYDIDRELRRLREPAAVAVDASEPLDTAGLAASVRRLLRAWQFPRLTSVAFDRESMDLVVSGRPRRNEGKGIRAILYSAFVIGLMRLCRDEGRPHPGFVVLDSPLTTYKGPMGRGPEDISLDMEAAFFDELANTSNETAPWEQIIIFDNKEPPVRVKGRINYIEFTGNDRAGRPGFVPVLQGEEVTSAGGPERV